MKYRKTVAAEHPNLDNREISRILGVRWRKLSDKEKFSFEYGLFHFYMTGKRGDRKKVKMSSVEVFLCAMVFKVTTVWLFFGSFGPSFATYYIDLMILIDTLFYNNDNC